MRAFSRKFLVMGVLLGLAGPALPVPSGGPLRAAWAGAPAVGARSGLPLAVAAAGSWAPDAALIYLENDEPLDAAGQSPRWSYLFFSAARDQARGYSVRDGKIVEAANLDFRFESLPMADTFIEAADALRAADERAGRQYGIDAGGQPATLLLVRNALADDRPDAPTWLVVYTAPDAPSLFVVVDATSGDVLKTWRG